MSLSWPERWFYGQPAVTVGHGFTVCRRPPDANLPSTWARPPRTHPPLAALTTLLGEELENTPPGSAAVTPILVDALLVYMPRAWLNDAAHTDGWSAALADRATAGPLAAIHQHPERAWRVAQLGATQLRHSGSTLDLAHFW